MPMVFNADEVLAMAEQIERNGQKFYLRAAEIVAEGDVHKLLTELAEWEKGHEALFAKMRADLPDDKKVAPVFDADGNAELYLQAAADTHVFDVRAEATDVLGGNETPVEILQKALSFERDSILFFVGLSRAVPARLGVAEVNRIVDEEMNHVAYLNKEIRRLKG